MIRVLLAEDMRILRDTLVSVLNLEDDIKVVAQVAAGTDIVPAALAERPGRLTVAADQQPLDFCRGQALGSTASRHDATSGTPSASGTSVRPVTCANRRNARSDVTIAFADHELRSRE